MNELEKQLSKIVEQALNVAEKTGEFVMEQAPQLLQEFYMWHTSKFILGILLGVTILLIGRFLSNFWSKKYNGENKEWDEAVLFGRVGEEVSMIVPFVVCSLIGTIILCINIYNLIFIIVAPKLYLIEYFIK